MELHCDKKCEYFLSKIQYLKRNMTVNNFPNSLVVTLAKNHFSSKFLQIIYAQQPFPSLFLLNFKLIQVSSSIDFIDSYINNKKKSQVNIQFKHQHKKNEKKCTISEFLDRNTKQIGIQDYS